MVATLSDELASRIASLVLAALHREYPNKIAHALESDADVRPPRELTPLFFGCYDWHSAVHGHWTLVRLLRTLPDAPFREAAAHALETSFSAARVEGELAYLAASSRQSFETPYGMAWLLVLGLELDEWEDPRAKRWRGVLSPLLELARGRLARWAERLPHPIRTGEHSQSAFALGLLLDHADACDEGLATAARRRAAALYGADRDGPLHLEPSGYDFLSPCLAEADLMRRVLGPEAFAAWLSRFLPQLPTDGSPSWLRPVSCPDPSDGKLAHLDGLNSSRAWMLEGIALGLPEADPRREALAAAAELHAEEGFAGVTGEHYEGSHWLGTFAVYLATGRGRRARGGAGAQASSLGTKPR